MTEKTFLEHQIEDVPGTFYTTQYCVKLCDFGLSRIQTSSGLICAPKYRVFDASVDIQTVYYDLRAVKVSWGNYPGL